MFTSDLQWDSNQISRNVTKHLVNDNRSEVHSHLRKVGRRIVTAAKAQVGKDTRELAESIHFTLQKTAGIPSVWIGSYNEIAYLHHEGTRPHAISARNAQVLRFSSKGRIVYARTVMHPGTPANKYLTDNIYLARI